MEILRGYGLGPDLQRLLQWYWNRQAVVPKSRKLFGRSFNKYRLVTQGDPFSTSIFNIVVYAVIRAVLLGVYGPQETHYGLGLVLGEHNIILYADYRRISERNLILVHTTLTEGIRMFERMRLLTIIGENKAMLCNPGLFWG